jgi:peptide/nickel transport system substrate-binding protein
MFGQEDEPRSGLLSRPLTRREVLKGAAAVGAAAGLGPLVGAWGGSASASPRATGTRKTGGNLKIGIVGGSAKDTADPQIAAFVPDDMLNWFMYEGLVEYTPTLTPQLWLAESVERNKTATVWTVRLKPGILWHNGKTVTADDVVYSFRRIVNPKSPKAGASALAGLKTSGIKKMDARTVRFSWSSPNVLFGTDGLTQRLVHMVPVGFDAMIKKGQYIGCGPWKLKTFMPGQQFVLEAFTHYRGGRPLLDKLTVTEFADPTARVNALLGGTIDTLVNLPPSQVKPVQGQGLHVLNARSGQWVPFCMRIDVKPFSDVRVRQAFRLMIDRKLVLQNAYGGIGWLGNDMYGVFDKGYPHNLPQRHQDLAQAKSLLKAAGYQDNLAVTIVTSDSVGDGAVGQATVFAENAKSAGVNVTVNNVDSSVIYGSQYLSWPFAMDYWGYRNYLQAAAAATVPNAPYNECHWRNAKWLALYNQAIRTANDAKRNEIVAEMATIEYNEGGYIIATFVSALDAYSTKVTGFVSNDVTGIPLGRWRLNNVHFV